jgi:hypothetical protein
VETATPPEPPAAAADETRKAGGGWSLLEKVLGLLTAVLTLAAAALGLWAARTSSDLDDATDERNELSADFEAAEARIGELEDELVQATSTTTTITAEDPTDDPGSGTTEGVLLSDLEVVVDRTWDVDRDLNIDGTVYANGIESGYLGYCGTNGPGTEQEVEYSINREYSRLSAVAGLSEESSPDLPVTLEIVGDGRSLWSETLIVGEPQTIDIDVTDVLRLQVVATKEFDNPGGCNYVYAGLGDPTLNN